ncbi:MAG TPA: hypothetical protein VGL81_16930 [Polyangiaceae bacterium]|jgi:hypothetical protein
MGVRWIGGLAFVAASSAAACSGQIASSPSDAGAVRDAPVIEEGQSAADAASPADDAGALQEAAPPAQGDSCQTPGVTCTVPPSPPSGATPPPTGTSPHDYALSQLFLGDTDRAGLLSGSAWESFGFNLDDLVTTEASKDVCTLAAGASTATQIDGVGGIDNSFGENLLPIVLSLAGSDFSARLDAELSAGWFTDLMYVTGFDDLSGNTTSANPLTGVLLAGGNYAAAHDGGAPAWDLATQWPIEPESLNGCPAGVCPPGTNPVTSAKVRFPSAYQKDGTFVSGAPTEILLTLSVGGAPLTLSIHAATLAFGPNIPGSVTNGTIAGVLAATELVSSLQGVAGELSTSLCSGSAFQSVAQQIEQSADIVLDATTGAVSNAPGVPCNGISIGLGFNATEIAPPASASIAGPTPTPSPCGDP